MAGNKIVRYGPTALTTTLTTSILNPPTTSGGVGAGAPNTYIVINHIHVVNKLATGATFSLWIGASGANAAGTEWFNAQNVPANSVFDLPVYTPLDTADFLVGGASTGSALTITLDAEIGLR